MQMSQVKKCDNIALFVCLFVLGISLAPWWHNLCSDLFVSVKMSNVILETEVKKEFLAESIAAAVNRQNEVSPARIWTFLEVKVHHAV